MGAVTRSALTRRRFLQATLAGTSALAFPSIAKDNYPSKTVHIILPYAPGGSADQVARLLAQKLSERFDEAFVVENKPGASGNIGLGQMVRSKADGYTLGLIPDSNLTVNPHLYKDLQFDPVGDTAGISLLTTIGIGLVVHEDVPANTVDEFIEYARSVKEGVSYGTPGIGTPHHFAGELLARAANLDLVHVPYKGGAPAVQDIASGQVPCGLVALAASAAQIDAGRMKLLAVTQAERSSQYPSTPTIGESIEGFEVTSWLGLFAPKNTSKEIITLLNTEINKILGEAEIQKILAGQALDVLGGTPAVLDDRVQSESKRWRDLIAATGISIEG